MGNDTLQSIGIVEQKDLYRHLRHWHKYDILIIYCLYVSSRLQRTLLMCHVLRSSQARLRLRNSLVGLAPLTICV